MRVKPSCFFKHALLHFADSIGKMGKLKMFHNLAYVQGIRVAVNNDASTSALTPLVDTYPASVLYPTPVIEYLARVHEVDFLDAMVILIVEELASPPTSTKRGRDVR